MERDTNGRPTRFDAGDQIVIWGTNYTLGEGEAAILNKGLRGKRKGIQTQVTLRETGRTYLNDYTFPVKKVLIQTGAIDTPNPNQ